MFHVYTDTFGAAFTTARDVNAYVAPLLCDKPVYVELLVDNEPVAYWSLTCGDELLSDNVNP